MCWKYWGILSNCLSVCLCGYSCTCLCICRYTCLCVCEGLRTTSGNIPQHYQSILRYSLLLTRDWPERLGWLARESHGSLCVWFFRREITHTWFLKSVDSGDRTSVLRLSRLARYHLSYFPPPHPRVTYLIYLEAHIEPSQNKDTLNDGLKEKYWYLYFRLSWVGNGVFTSKNMSKGQVEPYETLSWYGTTCDNYTWWYGIRGQPCGYTHCW